MKSVPLSIDNLPQFVGKELGVSRWVTIDQNRIDCFAECTEDRQWIHVDVPRARRESPVGGTIAHGYLSASMLAPFIFEVLVEPAGITRAINYGIDKLRFLHPVKAGAWIRGRITLKALENKGPGQWLITTDNTVEIYGEDKPALIATTLAVISAPTTAKEI
jgi:acyl dehydratase